MDQYRRQYDWCMPISSLPLSSTQATVCPCVHWRVGVSGWIIQMIVDVIKAPWAWLEALEPWRSEQSMGSPSSGQPPGIRGGVGCQRGSVEHEAARAAPVALAMHQVFPGPPPTAAVW